MEGGEVAVVLCLRFCVMMLVLLRVEFGRIQADRCTQWRRLSPRPLVVVRCGQRRRRQRPRVIVLVGTVRVGRAHAAPLRFRVGICTDLSIASGLYHLAIPHAQSNQNIHASAAARRRARPRRRPRSPSRRPLHHPRPRPPRLNQAAPLPPVAAVRPCGYAPGTCVGTGGGVNNKSSGDIILKIFLLIFSCTSDRVARGLVIARHPEVLAAYTTYGSRRLHRISTNAFFINAAFS